MTDLYSRQKKLREIGEVGQTKISQATVLIPAGPESEMAIEYLRRSGIGSIVVDAHILHPDFLHADHFQFEPCRTFAASAWIATQNVVRILESK
jgi:hypothetical protein